MGDYCGELSGCIGTLIGILDAHRTGHGRRVDVSMMDSLVFMLENQLSVFLHSGVTPKPNGNRYIVGSPVGSGVRTDGP